MKINKIIGGDGFTMNLMFVLFVTLVFLKMFKVIAWSWVWVTAPLWAPVTAVFVYTIFVLINTLMGGKWWDR